MPTKLKKTRIIFKKLNEAFSRLRNCDLRLKASDGEFSETTEIAIGKRYGTSQYGGDISGSFPVRSQFVYTAKNGTKKHVISFNTFLKIKNGNAWDNIASGLTADKFFDAIPVSSYKNSALVSGDVTPTYTGNTSTFTKQGDFTKIVVAGTPGWTNDLLVGREIYIDKTNLPATKLTIIKNDSTAVWVEGDYSTVATGQPYEILYPTVIFSLVDTTKTWTIDQYAGKFIRITAGVGAGQVRTITKNTRDTLSVNLPWEKDPDATSDYTIYDDEDKILYLGNGYDSMQRYDTSAVTALASVPKGNMFAEVQKRLVVAGDPNNPYTAYYSDIADPEYFDPTFVIRPPGDDKITGLIAWDNKGIILKERSLWLFDFVFNETTQIYEVPLTQIPSQAGCASPRSVKRVGSNVWFFTGKEIHSIGASTEQFGAVRTFDEGFVVSKLLQTVSAADALEAVAYSDDKKYYLSFPTLDLMLVYSIAYNTWLVWDHMYAYSFALDGSTILTGRGNSADEKVCQIEVTDQFNDLGEIITQTISIVYDDGDPDTAKFLRFIDYNFENIAGSVRHKINIVGQRRQTLLDQSFAIGHNLDSPGVIAEPEFGEVEFGGEESGKLRDGLRRSIGRNGHIFLLDIINEALDENMILTGLKFWQVDRGVQHYSRNFIH